MYDAFIFTNPRFFPLFNPQISKKQKSIWMRTTTRSRKESKILQWLNFARLSREVSELSPQFEFQGFDYLSEYLFILILSTLYWYNLKYFYYFFLLFFWTLTFSARLRGMKVGNVCFCLMSLFLFLFWFGLLIYLNLCYFGN